MMPIFMPADENSTGRKRKMLSKTFRSFDAEHFREFLKDGVRYLSLANHAVLRQGQNRFTIIRGYFGFEFFDRKFNFRIDLILHSSVSCARSHMTTAQSDSFFS